MKKLLLTDSIGTLFCGEHFISVDAQQLFRKEEGGQKSRAMNLVNINK